MKRFILALLASAGLSLPASAQQLQDLLRTDYWRVARGTSASGTPMCVLNTVLQSGGGLYVKFFRPPNSRPDLPIHVQLFRDTWRIPHGTQVPVVMQIDNASTWGGNAHGSSDSLELLLTGPERSRFLIQLAEGSRLVVTFPDGDAPRWNLTLRGTMAATDMFYRCMQSLDGSGGMARQPYSRRQQPATPAPAASARPEQRI